MLSSDLRGAVAFAIEHSMAKDAADRERIKAERLREALRANLRRRKAKPGPTAGSVNGESEKA